MGVAELNVGERNQLSLKADATNIIVPNVSTLIGKPFGLTVFYIE